MISGWKPTRRRRNSSSTHDIDRSSALIRETVQNSLDAGRDIGSHRVEVRIRLREGALLLGPDLLQPYVRGLLPHLKACGVGLDDVDLREPLLPVRVVSGLGDQIWRLVWESGPVLDELNRNEPEIKRLLTADPKFKWLILPEVLRSVLPRRRRRPVSEPRPG